MARERHRGSVQTYVALLRGINLGGHKRVSMADLSALFEEVRADGVTTYVQSGNVIFRSSDAPGALIPAVEERIRGRLGLDVTVLLRTRTQLARVVAGNPFADAEREWTKLHVTFLADAPDRARVGDLDPAPAKPDEFRVVGREIYLHCPNGYGRSKLTNAHFEKRLGVAGTTRNWKTVTKLAELSRPQRPSKT